MRLAPKEVAFALAILRKTTLEQSNPGIAGGVGTTFLAGRHLIKLRSPLTDVASGSQARKFERFGALNRDPRHLFGSQGNCRYQSEQASTHPLR